MPSAVHRNRLLRHWRLLVVSATLPAFAAPAPADAPPWFVVHGEFFDVYTDTSRSAAIDTAVWLEQFRRAVSSLWQIEPSAIRRATVVRFRSEREFRDYRDARSWGGYFANNDLMAIMATYDQGGAADSRELLQHECTHWLIGSSRPMPPWVNEGLAELYSTFDISGDHFTVFRAGAQNLAWLRRHGVRPLRPILLAERQDIDYGNRERLSAFYSQSWALIHFLLRGNGPNGAIRLSRFLGGIERGQLVEPTFTEAFGMDFEGAERALAAYVRRDDYSFARIGFERDALRRQFTAGPAPEVEVQCALAQLAITGRNDLDGAAARFRQARERHPDSPLPCEGLGCVEYYRHDDRSAAGYFREAMARGSRHPYAIYLPASVELSDRLSGDVDVGAVHPADARRLADAFKRALVLDPRLGRAADQLGLALLFAEPLHDEDLRFLIGSARLADDPPLVWYRTAGVLHRLGDRDQAQAFLDELTATGTPSLRQAAEADLGLLDQPPSQVRIGLRRIAAAPSTAPHVPRTRIEIPRH